MLCKIGICVDGGVDAVEGREEGYWGRSEEGGVSGGEGVEVLAAEVRYVVVGGAAVLAGDVSTTVGVSAQVGLSGESVFTRW